VRIRQADSVNIPWVTKSSSTLFKGTFLSEKRDQFNYHRWRPHQGLGNVPLDERDKAPSELSDTVPLGEIVRHEMLGGLLKHYERKAA
jgi:hypothetical protein